jgi:hypothetical protein
LFYVFEKRNAEFEDPTDPFHPPSRRYRLELNRYLENNNLNFMPPMPKPVYKNNNNTSKINTHRIRAKMSNNFQNSSSNKNNNSNNIGSKTSYSVSNISDLNQMSVTQTTNYS